jgi:glutamyl-tRNA synthetase
MRVRTRFAPSPTGFQHIGGFRTALYAWLVAKHFGGDFLLRVEDTDSERKVDGAVRYLIESLEWLGITIDEGPSREDLQESGDFWPEAPQGGGGSGPYIQSARVKNGRYQEIADLLVAQGFAYRCDMTAEQLEAERTAQEQRGEMPGYSGYSRERNVGKDTTHVVRFKMPEQVTVSIQDAVRGVVTWENPPLRDPVLLKSDGVPTYHLASVVDDHDMKITHVMRGEEWLATAPLHGLLYDALGWDRPLFVHLPVILGSDGKKLSKRTGALGVNHFKELGYLPEALLNGLALIGWSPGEGSDQEIFSIEELIKAFSVSKIGASSGVYDPQKLEWFNGMHLRKISLERFSALAKPFFEKAGVELNETSWNILAPHVQERCKLLTDAVSVARFAFEDAIEPDLSILPSKKIDNEIAVTVLTVARAVFSEMAESTPAAVEAGIAKIAADTGLKPGQVMVTLRLVVTGSMATPPLTDSIAAVGKERAGARIVLALFKLENA